MEYWSDGVMEWWRRAGDWSGGGLEGWVFNNVLLLEEL